MLPELSSKEMILLCLKYTPHAFLCPSVAKCYPFTWNAVFPTPVLQGHLNEGFADASFTFILLKSLNYPCGCCFWHHSYPTSVLQSVITPLLFFFKKTVCYFIAQISFKEQNAPSMFGEFRVLDTGTPSMFAPVKPNSTVQFMLNNITSRQLTEWK